jgi:hypothetical protein
VGIARRAFYPRPSDEGDAVSDPWEDEGYSGEDDWESQESVATDLEDDFEVDEDSEPEDDEIEGA